MVNVLANFLCLLSTNQAKYILNFFTSFSPHSALSSHLADKKAFSYKILKTIFESYFWKLDQ